jgi:alpha-tubulin suppressor-like RCC1 family protein
MWGVQFDYQLGNGLNRNICSTPIQVGSAYPWIEISIGVTGNFAAGMTTNNFIANWGNNAQGQCGVGNTVNQPYPLSGGGSGWMANGFSIATGSAHTLALKSNSTLWATGYNNKGQLGIGTVINYSSYIMVSGNTNWYTVAAGAYTSYAITNTGVLYGWGYNANGQIGNGSTVDSRTPIAISTGSSSILWVLPTRVRKTISSFYHTLAIGNNNFLYGWGVNWSGAIGNSSTLNVSKPTFIGTNFYSVSVGQSHSAGIKLDNTLWTWGINNSGQLGQNSTIPCSSPVQVAGTWLSVACSSYGTLGLRTDGSLWAWGGNTDKTLGVGSTLANVSSPMQVLTSINNWQVVYAGYRAFGAL